MRNYHLNNNYIVYSIKKQKSQNPTEEVLNAIEVLKRNGINLVYEDEKGKIVNTIKKEDTIEKMLERYQSNHNRCR